MTRPIPTQSTSADLRWQRLADAALVGEEPSSEANFIRDYPGESRATRAEREFMGALRRRGAERLDSADVDADEELVKHAVRSFLAAPEVDPAARMPSPTPIGRGRRPLMIGGVAMGSLAAAASWLLLSTPAGERGEGGEDRLIASWSERAASARDVQSTQPPVQPPIEPPAESTLALTLLGGTLIQDGRSIEHQEGTDVALADGSLVLRPGACIGLRDRFRACGGTTGTTTTAVTIRGRGIELDRGTVRVELARPEVGVVWVEVAGVALLGDAPGVVVIHREVETWNLSAEEGPVHLRVGGASEVLAAGESLGGRAGLADPTDAHGDDPSEVPKADPGARVRPSSDPRALLGEAQTKRGAGEYRAAAGAYRRLIREHGGTSLARTAQVALGQLYLGPLDRPAKALRAFDAYLRSAPGGAMAEEALHGKISALRSLRRSSAADQASADFLRRFPRSGYAAGIRRALDTPR